MGLLARVLRLLAIVAFNLILGFTVAAFRLIVLPLLLVVLRLCGNLILFSFRATVNGPGRFINRLAGEWTERIHQVVDDRNHIYEVFLLCRFIAGALVVLGWLFTTLFTVAILRVVFGFFI